jgi:hypothetical protein
MNLCKYCNKEFSNQYNLKVHVKSSKKCIQERNDNSTEIIEYSCDWCNKKCSTNSNLISHKKNCKLNPSINKDFLIKELENKIEQLKNENNKIVNKYTIDIEVLKNDMIKKDIEIEKLKTEIRVKDELRRENNLFNKK